MDHASHIELQQKLHRLEQALERCERLALASLYASAVIHEVNNPLEAITNLVYITKIQKRDAALVAENMDIIQQQLAILGKMTSQALKFHRAQTEARDWDLVAIAESALKLHAGKIARHGVTVDSRFSRPAVAQIFGSEILQVISNLILNAIDALPRKNGRISIRVRTCGHSACVTVSDNGKGMPVHIAQHLFEPYMTSKTQGIGLGLWLSRRIVVKQNGTLRFRTSQRAGRSGTAFRISLPLRAPNNP